MNKDWQKTFNSIKKEVNDLILIPGAPENEFDGLVFGIQSRLANKSSIEELEDYIRYYLNEYVGLSVTDDQVENLMNKVIKSQRFLYN
ncbi:MAG: hypothetical protein ACI8Q1_001395 [Parvicella sp.]|jgi:uncharacterized protein YggL (DUF469 family)